MTAKWEDNSQYEKEAWYMLKHQCTLKEAASYFKKSKTTLHLDITVRLNDIDPILYRAVRVLLNKNKEEGSLRGGLASAKKRKEKEEQKKQCEELN